MSFPRLRLIGCCSVVLFGAWACLPDIDALSSEYGAGAGGSAGSAGLGSGGKGVNGGSGGSGASAGTGGPAGSGGTDLGGEGGMPASGGTAGDATAGADNSSGDGGAPPEPPPSCENQTRDPDESDVDCGGTSACERCRDHRVCTRDDDCESSVCKDDRCAAPTCEDDHQNQDETGTDCGGSCAPDLTCDLGIGCREGDDCTSGYCKDATCVHHCESGEHDADETGADCGGSECGACGDLQPCEVPADCISKVCSDQVCQAATCSDGVLNQDESDEDCGGTCALEAPCEIDDHCNAGADCASYVCVEERCAPDIEILAEDIVDDFEDRDLVVKVAGGRVGNWYPYGDGTGILSAQIVAIPGERGPASAVGLHTQGSGFTSWGSGVGADINNPGASQATKLPYDASAYTGITFWAQADAATTLTLVLPDKNTDAAGGTCVVCDHHHLKTLGISSTWQRYTVPFSELVLEAGGDPIPDAFAADGVVSVQFRFATGLTYDVSIDDIAFVR